MEGCEDVLFGKRAVIEFLTPEKTNCLPSPLIAVCRQYVGINVLM